MVEVLGESLDLGAGRGLGFCALRPADGGGDVDRGDQRRVGFRQLGVGAGAVGYLQAGSFAAGGEAGGDGDQ